MKAFLTHPLETQAGPEVLQEVSLRTAYSWHLATLSSSLVKVPILVPVTAPKITLLGLWLLTPPRDQLWGS